MIEIIKDKVEMPPFDERRYKKRFINNKWVVMDTINNTIRYKGRFEDVVLACHNLNKKHYQL